MRIALVLAVAAAAGCAGGSAVPDARTYDLGVSAPATALAAVRIASVRASAPFDGTEMRYRLAWRNAAEIAAFAHSRWAAPPAELLRRQLLRAAAQGPAKCALEIEVHDFTQVFAARDSSEARIEFKASVTGGNQRVLSVVEGGAGPDAASGAAAFARAADRAVAELAGWVTAQPGCR